MRTWTVADVMIGHKATTGAMNMTDVVTTTPDAPLATAASLMFEHHLTVLPVIDLEKRLVGIVSRTQMLKVFLRRDESIRKEIVDGLGDVIGGDRVEVAVLEGMVHLQGNVDMPSAIEQIGRLVAGVPGVVGVANDLEVTGEPD